MSYNFQLAVISLRMPDSIGSINRHRDSLNNTIEKEELLTLHQESKLCPGVVPLRTASRMAGRQNDVSEKRVDGP